MTKSYILLGTPLLVSTLLTSGCSATKPKSPLKTTKQSVNAASKSKLAKQPKADNSVKNVHNKNAKISDKISSLEEKINTLEKKISETPLGVERAKLVKSKTPLEEKIASLRKEQIDNAKAFQIAKQQEASELKKSL